MIDIPARILLRAGAHEIGLWLDSNLPNPPNDEPQRWTLGYSEDGRVGLRFFNDDDATLFCLRWGGNDLNQNY